MEVDFIFVPSLSTPLKMRSALKTLIWDCLASPRNTGKGILSTGTLSRKRKSNGICTLLAKSSNCLIVSAFVPPSMPKQLWDAIHIAIYCKTRTLNSPIITIRRQIDSVSSCHFLCIYHCKCTIFSERSQISQELI